MRRSPHAWWLSVLFHAALFVLCGLFWREVVPSGVEPDRAGELAFAVTTPDRTEYLTFEQSPDGAEASKEMASSAEHSDTTEAAAGGLPATTESSAASLPDALKLPLPGTATPTLDLATPRTTGAASVKLPNKTDYTEFLNAERARIRSQMPRGQPVEVSLFGGPPSVGRSFVFVIDRSKSMGGSGLNALRTAAKELTAALARLEPVHRFTVIAYHHTNTYLDGPKLIDATTNNQQRVAPFLNGLAAFGQTEHELGLNAALGLEPDVIYLFTDGGDPYLSEPQMRLIAATAARQRTTIHCVQFGNGPLEDSNNFLVRLANQCNGGFTYIDTHQMRGERD